MNFDRTLKMTAAALCLNLVVTQTMMAEVDLSGSWVAKNHEDAMERGAGPNPGDFTGLPFNESGRAKALSYSQSQLSMPERICAFYTQWHMNIGPFNLKIWNETDPVTGRTVAWVVGAWETRGPMTIWMDGRPRPGKNDPHGQSGFTTGVWEGDTLVATTTHMKTGYMRRNGAPLSDQAVLTTRFIRHGDMITLASSMDDPIYYTEPYTVTRSYQRTDNLLNSGGPPCIPGDEGLEEGRVPHYLPGKNPLGDEMLKRYGIPAAAALGGAETMLPAYRDKMKDQFKLPEGRCKRDCGAGGGGAN